MFRLWNFLAAARADVSLCSYVRRSFARELTRIGPCHPTLRDGDMMVLGKTEAAVALPVGDATLDGPLAALLRRAAYLYRMPTNEHRAKLATNWLQQSAQFAAEEGPGIMKRLGVPVPDFVLDAVAAATQQQRSR